MACGLHGCPWVFPIINQCQLIKPSDHKLNIIYAHRPSLWVKLRYISIIQIWDWWKATVYTVHSMLPVSASQWYPDWKLTEKVWISLWISKKTAKSQPSIMRLFNIPIYIYLIHWIPPFMKYKYWRTAANHGNLCKDTDFIRLRL